MYRIYINFRFNRDRIKRSRIKSYLNLIFGLFWEISLTFFFLIALIVIFTIYFLFINLKGQLKLFFIEGVFSYFVK